MSIDFDAHVARNRELIMALPPPHVYESALTWNPERLAYDIDEDKLDLFHEMFETFN